MPQRGGSTTRPIRRCLRAPVALHELDLHINDPGFVTAALGGSVEVPTLEGEVSLKVPAETQSGRVFRLRGKGVRPVRGGEQGDLFCRVVVETPVKLSAEQKAMLQKFDESLRGDRTAHAPRQKSFFEGVKRFFAGEPQ